MNQQKIRPNYIKICQKKWQKKNQGSSRYLKEPQDLENYLQDFENSLISVNPDHFACQSPFLEALLVRQADGKLKKGLS